MRIALLAVPLLLVLAACGGGGATSAPATNPPAAGVEVNIVDFAYDPRSASASVGAQVTWTNSDQAPHTVTFDDGTDLGQVGNGETVNRTFNEAGDFPYVCTIHPSMRGVVVVQ